MGKSLVWLGFTEKEGFVEKEGFDDWAEEDDNDAGMIVMKWWVITDNDWTGKSSHLNEKADDDIIAVC